MTKIDTWIRDDRDAWVASRLAFFLVRIYGYGEGGRGGGGEVGVVLFLGVEATMMVVVVVFVVVLVVVVVVLAMVDDNRGQTTKALCQEKVA